MTENLSSEIADEPKSIILVPYPKIILLYPTFLVTFLAAIVLTFAKPNEAGQLPCWPSVVFQIVFALNLVVYAFDFPRTTSLTLFFFIAALVLGGLLLVQYQPQLLPTFYAMLQAIQPRADASFYWCLTGVFTLIFMAVIVNVRFDYWEVRPNELLHHHGFLSNLERFSAPNLRISKEINDVFEFMLMGSGRLILHPSNEPRAFVLDNIPMINRREDQITQMLGTLQVQVRQDAPHS